MLSSRQRMNTRGGSRSQVASSSISESSALPNSVDAGASTKRHSAGNESGQSAKPESSTLPTTDTIVTGQKRKVAANKSPLWEYFTKCNIPGTEIWDKTYCTCNICHEKVLCKTDKNGTSSRKLKAAFGDLDVEGVDMAGLDDISRKLLMQRMAAKSHCIKNEVDQYLADPYVSLIVQKFDIHKWWKCNEAQYPVLSKLAKDILAMPCSTVASENAFSLGSRVVDPFRASLTPKTVEALVCMSDWLRATPANLYNDPTQEQLQIYAELEELEKDEIINLGGPSPSHSTSVPTTN